MALSALWVTLGIKDLLSKKAKDVSGSLKTVSKDADKTVNSMKKLQDTLQGLAGAQIFAKAEAGLRDILGPAAQFQEQLALIRTLSGATKEETEQLGNSFKELGKIYGTNPLDQAAGAFQLLDDGIDNTTDALKALVPANKLVVAGGVSMGTAIKGLTDMTNAYGFSMEQLPHVANVFQLTNVKGATSVGSVISFMQLVAPTAENLGTKFEELAAIIATMTGAGVRDAQAFKAINQVMTNVYTNASKLDPVVKRLFKGMNLQQVMAMSPEQGGGLVGIINAISKDGKRGAKTLEEIGLKGKVLQAFLKVIGGNFKEFQSNMGAMLTDTKTLDEQFAIATDTPAFKWKQLKAAIDATKISIGEQFLNAISPVLVKMNEYGKRLSDWIAKHPKAAKWISLVLVGVIALGVALGGLAVVIGILSLITLPILIIFAAVAAVIGVVVIAIMNWSRVSNFFKGVWKGMCDAVSSAWNAAVGFIMGLASSFWSFLTGIWSNGVSAITTIWEGLKTSLAPTIQILSEIGSVAKTVFEESFITPIKSIIEFVQQAIGWIGKMVDALGSALDSIGDNVILNPFSSVDEIRKRREQKIQTGPGQSSPSTPQFAPVTPTPLPPSRETFQNTALSAARSPGVQAAGRPAPVNVAINVPQSKITSAPVQLDKRVIGEVVMEMIRQQTVRAAV